MNITAVKDILSRRFRGATIDSVLGISDYTLFKEAASNLLLEISPEETKRQATIDIFSGVYDYDPADDIKEIVDIRPQTDVRESRDNPLRVFSEDFDLYKRESNLTLETIDATKILRYSKDFGQSKNITETIDDNWTAGTGVSNIAEDTINFAENSRSLRFDISNGTNLIEWNGDVALDLASHESKSSLFLWVYYPDSSIITSLTLRLGSSSGVYFERTGVIHFGSIRSGWNLYRFAWNGATETGTANTAAIDYARLALVATAADTDVRIGLLKSKLPKPKEYLYYSNYLFRSSGGTWLEQPTADTDIVNLDTDAHNLFLDECSLLIAGQMTNGDDILLYQNKLFGRGVLVGAYERYRRRHPEESIRPVVQHRRFSYQRK